MAPPRNQAATEKTNINLYHSENPVYSPKLAQSLSHSVIGLFFNRIDTTSNILVPSIPNNSF